MGDHPAGRWATRPGFRIATIAVTLVVGIFGPTANGDRFALFQILDATLASAVIVLLLIAVTYNRLPWRKLPDASRPAPPGTRRHRAAAEPAQRPPGAYAESP